MGFIMKLSEQHDAIVSRFRRSQERFFYKVMTRTSVTAVVKGPFAYQLEFPVQFLDNHADQFKENATLEKPDCATKWPIKITVRNFKLPDKTRAFAYGDGGWRAFVKENDIKVGDLVVFCLVGSSRFKAHIFPRKDGRRERRRRLNDDHNDAPRESAPEKLAADEAPNENIETAPEELAADEAPNENIVNECAECGQSSQPRLLFMATVMPAINYNEDTFGARRTRLDIPGNFWRRHRQMLRGDEISLRGPNRVVMKVRLREYKLASRARVRLESGWREFFTANRLQVGDNLLFTLAGPSRFEVERMDRIP